MSLATGTFATLAGHRVVTGTVHVPGFGAWVADVELDAIPAIPIVGRVSLVIGDLELSGTVLTPAAGSFAGQSWYRIVAGAAGWSRVLPGRAYHNDAALKRSLVLNDAAAEAGEVLADHDATSGPLSPDELDPPNVAGVDFIRESGPASRVFGQVIDSTEPASGWWVDYLGITHVGPRPVPLPNPAAQFELVDYLPGRRLAILATETPASIQVGMTITAGALAAPVTVREFDLDLTADSLRVRAWVDEVGATGSLDDRLLRAIRSVVRETFPRLSFLGTYRYRVVAMTSTRASLQIVRKAVGLPNQTLISIAPGIPGQWASLTPGSIVLVGFAEGDPSQPYIAHHPARGEPGFAPGNVRIESSGVITVGPAATRIDLANGSDQLAIGQELGRVVRYGDRVELPVAGSLASGQLIQRASSAPNPIAKVSAQ